MFFPHRHRENSCCLATKDARAFTLVEIALAIGIFAFAIVAIMALFPVGLRSANESRVETIVAQIARTVLSDLRTGTFSAAQIVTVPDPSPIPSFYKKTFTTFNLTQNPPTPVYLLYRSDGSVISVTTRYATGDAAGDFMVKVESQLIQTTAPFLAQVSVTVEAPAAAPVANRTKYPVVTLMGDTR